MNNNYLVNMFYCVDNKQIWTEKVGTQMGDNIIVTSAHLSNNERIVAVVSFWLYSTITASVGLESPGSDDEHSLIFLVKTV